MGRRIPPVKSYTVSYKSQSDEAAGGHPAVCPNCGQTVGDQVQFCPVCGWSLGGPPEKGASVSCPLCWSPNPAFNRFCESCAARLGVRSGYEDKRLRGGGRRPTYSGGVLTVGFGLGLVFMVVLVAIAIGRDESLPSETTVPRVPATSTSSSIPPTQALSSDPVGPRPLQPSGVVASSELSDEYGAENLVDGAVETVWRDASMHGDEAVMTFSFEGAVRVNAIVLHGIPDDEAFHRSYRIRGFRLDPGGGGALVEGEAPDSTEPYRIDLGGVETSVVALEVVSTYPGEPHGDQSATEELAVAEIEILGQQNP